MTRSLIRIVAVACLIACAALAAPSASSAKISVGIGAPSAEDTFPNPLFKSLGMKRARVVVPYNVAQKRSLRAGLTSYLRIARQNRIEVLVHLGAANGTRCPRRPCKLPSVKAFTRAFKAFRKYYRSQRVIGVWNEANHITQPTFRNPKRAAQFFNVVRKRCRGCKIVAADIIDESNNMARWIKVFRKTARGVRIWGLHNYLDANYTRGRKSGGTRRFIRATRRGQVWFTETGGVVKFVLRTGRTQLRFSESRANKATRRMYSLAKKYRKRVKRIYVYNWRAPLPKARFDSGLIRHFNITDPSSLRPAYFTVQKNMRSRYFGP
jgi:hypothetical protein